MSRVNGSCAHVGKLSWCTLLEGLICFHICTLVCGICSSILRQENNRASTSNMERHIGKHIPKACYAFLYREHPSTFCTLAVFTSCQRVKCNCSYGPERAIDGAAFSDRLRLVRYLRVSPCAGCITDRPLRAMPFATMVSNSTCRLCALSK